MNMARWRRRWLMAIGTVLLPGLASALSGQIFRDYDGDNTKATLEPLIGNAVITAYGNNNTVCGSTTSVFTGNPNFSFTPSAAGDCAVATYRVEFTVYPFGVTGFASSAGANTSVQFLAGNATGVIHPARSGNDYCSATPTNPTTLRVAASRHFIGAASGTLPTLIDFPYNQSGDPIADTTASTQGETGSLYGMAWQRSMRRLYSSAYMRRFVGNAGLGKIYRVTRNAANTGWVANSTAVYADLEALFPGSAGTDPRGVGFDYTLDTTIFDQVGKTGIGDMAISEDDNTLYVVALGDRRLYQLPADSINAITSPAQVAATSIPRPASCVVDSDFRPFGLGIEGGDVYVGAVCTGQSSATAGNTCRINGDRSLLRGYVLRFRPGTGFDATPVFDFPLNYPRGDVDPAGGCLPDGDPTTPGTQVLGNARWNVWTSSRANTPYQANGQVYPQPMLVEIAFDRGDLIIGFRDRVTDQGRNDQLPDSANSITGGEFLRACKQSDGSFQLESNGSCTGINGTFTGGVGTGGNGARGPGTTAFGGEAYPMDHYSNDGSNTPTSNQPASFDGGPHDEVGAGALAMVPGNQYVMATFFDPWNEYGAGGVRRMDNVNPTTPASGYEIYDAGDNTAANGMGFYKATALGDIELMCDIAPRIIGNRVWSDVDSNGRQDPTEAGVAGQIVELYSSAGQLLGRTSTDANGNYAFVVTPLFTGSDANVNNNTVELTSTTINGASFYVALGSNVTGAQATTAHAAAAGTGTAGTLQGGIGDFRDSDGTAQSVPNAGTRVAALITLGPANNITSVDFGVLNGLDFGDLPDTGAGVGANNYETLLANNGPRHTIVPTLYLGAGVDAEANGFNTAAANGDDGNGSDDEDGVPAAGLSGNAGATEFINLTLNNSQGSAARLCVFTDWNADGDFSDGSEAQFFSVPDASTGLTIGLTVPAIGGGVAVGNKFQRYRLLPTGAACAAADNLGLAAAGEVEDYVFALAAAVSGSDFGDLPNGVYLTSGAGAASHTIVSNLYLGAGPPDSEADGVPTGIATGDDSNGVDDEDSIPTSLLVIDNNATTLLPVTLVNNTGATARICAYVDYNADGDFADTNEGPLTGATGIAITSSAAIQTIALSLAPANLGTPANARLRVRLTSSGTCDFDSALGNGEVEDYLLTQFNNNRDFGDLPDTGAGTGANNFETLLANNGPFHNIIAQLRLGSLNDAETNGVNSPAGAPPRGDDNAVSDDEDGISESVLFVPAAGGTITFPVAVVNTTGAAATLCTFVDTNENGVMGDIVLTTPVPNGATTVSNSLTFAGGANAQGYVRFRLIPTTFTCASPANVVGGYSAGEVEDYRYYKGDVDFGDLPDSGPGSGSGNYQTTEFDNGAAHRIIATLGLGANVDGDDGTVQGATAEGDDQTGAPDDEDAIAASALSVGLGAAISIPVTVRNTTGAAVGLCGLLDINGDGVFADTAAERSFVSVANNATSANLSFSNAPASAISTYLRVRISSTFTAAANCLTAGIAENGEVEDYQFTVGGPRDFGDLPSVGTYQNGGQAAHTLSTGLYLGIAPPDAETAPAPSTGADGDNLTGNNDEDGIPTPLLTYVQGHTLNLPIGVTNATASVAGVCSFADLNGDGDFADGGEVQFSAVAANSGTQTIWAAFGAVTDATSPLYARIRISQSYLSILNCSSIGTTGSGEVEDYALTAVTSTDYGDLNFAAITQNPNGARHGIVGDLRIGALNDAEADGVPSGTATGDDSAGSDDEDGVSLLALRAPPTLSTVIPVTVVNTTGASARLCTFFDANNDGDFGDPGDAIVTTLVSNAAVSVNVPFTVPGGTSSGDKPMRFRLSSANPAVNCVQADSVGGFANGEVEDYLFRVGPFDFGDAPDAAAGTAAGNYQTRSTDGGPSHLLVASLRLGTVGPDADDGSLQGTAATADDLDDFDDEDGTTMLSVPTSTAVTIPVTATNTSVSTAGVCVMLDLDGNGVFANTAAERAFFTVAAGSGTTTTNAALGTSPAGATTTYLRLRLSTQFNNAASCDTADAIDGEVEDFRFVIGNVDFGDLQQVAGGGLPAYTAVDGGAATIVTTIRLGTVGPDAETAIQGSALADGDDTTAVDDEDGLSPVQLALTGNTTLPVFVTNTSGANVDLCVLIDWNRDGDAFNDANERVFVNEISSGAGDRLTTDPVVTAPGGQTAGPVAVRLMLMQETGAAVGDCGPDTQETSGEVEDYILIAGNPDFGDAPNTYGTNLASNGPRHGITADGGGTTLRFGANAPDAEANGNPGALANGDGADEDGISTLPTLIEGSSQYQVTLTATNDIDATAGICAYLDVNGSGVFEPSEVQFTTIADGVTAGTALVTWPLTSQLVPQGSTYLRIRTSTAFASVANCSPQGPAPNGEIEDYVVTVQSRDFGDLPDTAAGISASSGGQPPNYRTTLADGGPRHTISGSLRLGQVNDADLDGTNSLSTADDIVDTVDDEEAILSFSRSPSQPTNAPITVNVLATNTTGAAARICFFVDRNADGDFADPGEIGTGAVPNNTVDGSIAVVVPAIASAPTQPAGTPGIGMRLRIAAESVLGATCEAAEADGQLTGSGDPAIGEVEDYYTGAANTVPVTLSAVDARQAGSGLVVRFLAASEAGTLGYNVWSSTADDRGERHLVNPTLLPAVAKGLKGAEYAASGGLVAGHTQVWIEELDLGGKSTHYGPYAINKASGDFDLARSIDWARIGAERSSFVAQDLARRRSEGTAQAVQIAVEQDGWVRVPAADVLSQAPALAGTAVSSLALSRHDRAPVALKVRSADGVFDGSDSVEFYGRAVSDNLYTRTAFYTLAAGSAVVQNELANAAPAVTPVSAGAARASHRPNRLYGTEIPGSDPWYAARVVRSGANPASVSESFQLTGRVPAGGEALTVLVRGGLDFAGEAPDHALDVLLNDTLLGSASFDGLTYRELRYELPAGLLREGDNTLTLRLPASTPYSADRINLEGLVVDFQQALSLPAGGRLDVALTQKAPGDNLLANGFESVAAPKASSGPTLVRVDVAAASAAADLRFVRLRDGKPELVEGWSVAVDGSGQRHVLLGFDDVQSDDRLLAQDYSGTAASALTPYVPAADPLGNTPADLLIISDDQFAAALPPLVAAREAEGLTVRLVSAQDVVSYFNGGVRDAVAFSRAITAARSQIGIRYVLLVGADTYDYFNYSGLGAVSFIPTPYRATSTFVQQAPVDALYGDSNGDGLTELAIGRLPARTLTDAQVMVSKTLAYASGGHAGTTLAISDREQSGYRFADVSEQWSALLTGNWQRQSLKMETFSNDAAGLAQARGALYGHWNSGQALTTFYGHSAPAVWTRQSLLTQAYLQSNPLSNGSVPTTVIQWGCWGGYVVEPAANSVAQGLLAQPGGAALVIGAAGLTETPSDEALATRLMPLLGEPGARFGDALVAAQAQLHLADPTLIDVLLGMTLLGDPTLVIRSPTPP